MAEENGSNRQKLSALWHRLKPFMCRHWGLYLAASVLSVLTLSTSVTFPQMIRAVIDQGIQAGNMQSVYFWVIAMAGLLVVQATATYFRFSLLMLGAERVTAAIRTWLFGRFIQHEMGFFDEEGSDNLTSRLIQDIQELRTTLSHLVPEIIQASLRCLVAGGLMIYTSPTLSGVVLVVGPILWLGSSILARSIRHGAGRIQTERAKLQAKISESLKGILTVRVYHREEKAVEDLEESSENVIRSSLSNIRSQSLLEGYTNLFSEGAVVLAIWIGAILILGGTLTPGALVTFILYAGLLTRGASTLSHSGARLMQAQGATNRIFEIGERETLMPPFATGEIPETCRGEIELRDIHFSYPTRPDVAAVHGIHLTTQPGEEIALVGSSGCGKSTVAKLITRLYDPDAGQVLLDGHDVRDLDSEWLREKITLVPPEPVIFTGTVAENIRFGKTEASDEEVRSAARVAHAAEFIETLPESYESHVGDDGRLLSSGQRQRIALARAVLRGAQVLILDESTASLDTQTEAVVKESLRKLPHQPTLILISHRLSTIIDARRVIVMDAGVVVAEGSHSELTQTSSFYQNLVKDQLVSD